MQQQRSDRDDQGPSYDLPTSSRKQEDDTTGHRPHRMRRPAPEHIEQERLIKPFSKHALTFMFHATYANNLGGILEEGIKPGKDSAPRGRVHVHLASIDDIIFNDQPPGEQIPTFLAVVMPL